MRKFFFNVRENGVLQRDHEGVTCSDAAQACLGARAAMHDFARETEVVAARWPVSLEVTDEQGNVIAAISAQECLNEAHAREHLTFS